MKQKLTVFLLFMVPLLARAQGGETLMPLEGYGALDEYIRSHPEVVESGISGSLNKHLGKAAGDFPFIERFDYDFDSISRGRWVFNGGVIPVTKSGRRMVFNAIDFNNNPYSGGNGSYGIADEARSQPINLSLAGGGSAYITFIYNTGTTYSPGDSLVLYCKTGSGNEQKVWSSPDGITPPTEVTIDLPLTLYGSAGFDFRFVNSCSRTAANINNFNISQVAVSSRWILPVYENFLTDTVISPKLWLQRGPSWIPDSVAGVRTGKESGIYFGHAAAFDARDEYGNVYNGANGSTGFADTLTSHLIDVEQFTPFDSVYLRFFYKSMPNWNAGDSLVVECKNNLGEWRRVMASGSTGGVIDTFIMEVNTGRFRHRNFQFRVIGKCKYTANDTLKYIVSGFNIGRKLLMAFRDDFSGVSVFPDKNLWTTKHTYINNSFPVKPPSFNVATFDGLTYWGSAYGGSQVGYCDSLTSWPVNLSGYSPKDSICMTFYFEPQGLGDEVEPNDSLILEFRANAINSSFFRNIWATSPVGLPVNSFTPVTIMLRDSLFFHDDFQFRFKNYGSRTGNLDQWHVDYIRMDKGLCSAGYLYTDIAVTDVPPSLLSKYISMPVRHFAANPSEFVSQQQFFSIRNNSSLGYPVNFNRRVFDPAGTQVDAFLNTDPNFDGQSDKLATVNQLPAIQPQNFAGGDSVIFNTSYTSRLISGADDFIPGNDSVVVKTVFSNYFAYDDGSAEAGYGVKPGQGSLGPWAVALGYDLTVPDTLVGVSIFFNKSSTDVSTYDFDLVVWQGINTQGNGLGEVQLKRVYFGVPVYDRGMNGFFYYRFQEPLVLPPGRFYIGWEQNKIFELNVGFDRNYEEVNPNLFYKADGLWDRTRFTGALMLRPLMGRWIDPPLGAKELQPEAKEKLDAIVYPNPAKDVLRVQTQVTGALTLELFDLSGKSLLLKKVSDGAELNLPALSDGLYIVHLREERTGSSVSQKVMITK